MNNNRYKIDNRMSVVIPVRNREHLIGRCLESVKAQTWRPMHVIVVDNGSADNTRKVVEDWIHGNEEEAFKVTVVEESKPGAAVARNRGLKEVDTDFMLFFDSDDMMRQDMIENVMFEFSRCANIDLVYWKSIVKGNKASGLKKFTLTDQWKCHIYHALLCTQCFAVRTSFFKEAGCWDDSLPCWNDWELGIRLLLGNPKMVGIDKVLAEIYPQKESITGENFYSKAGDWERAIDTAERDVEQSGRDDADRLIDMVNYRRAILAAHYKRENRSDLAKPLLRKALSHRTLSLSRKWLLRLLYHYTALGGRGAYLLWK